MPARWPRLQTVLRGLVVGVCLWLIAAPAQAALGKNEIRELEVLLAHLGFDPGPVDGVLDVQTRTAIKGYQDFAALPVTGQASRDLLDELRGVTESLDAVRIPETAPRAVAEPETVITQEAVAQPVLAAPKPPGPKPAAPEKAAVQTAAVQTEAPEAPAAETASASTRAAPFEFAIQLASVRTKDGAEIEWKRLQRQFPDLLARRDLAIQIVDLEARGTFFRVLTGPFEDRTDAQDFCAEFKSREQNCLVARLTDAP